MARDKCGEYRNWDDDPRRNETNDCHLSLDEFMIYAVRYPTEIVT